MTAMGPKHAGASGGALVAGDRSAPCRYGMWHAEKSLALGLVSAST